MSKKLVNGLLLVFLSGLTTVSAQGNLSDGLLGYWPLDEGAGGTAADISGNGSEGTLNGGPNWVVGKLGNALEFDGSDDYVDCGNGPILDLVGASDFTISAWVNTSAAGGETIFAKGGDDGGGIRYRLFIEGNPGVKMLVDDDSTKYDPEGNIQVVDGQWHHIVGMRDGTALRVFIDGVEDEGVPAHSESTIPADYDISGTSQYNAYIGCLTSNSGGNLIKFFSGLIDDVAFWNRALTLDEIGYLWNNGDGNPAAGSDPEKASSPSLDDGAEDVPRDVVLGWTPGEFANTHDVYFGTAFDDVNTASVSDPMGALISAGQDGSTFNPDRLAFGQTYYWRVDEVNGAPDFTVFKGDVWSFTTEPIGIPITQITATASSSFGDTGPERTIDGSGLVDDLHDVDAGAMWISGGVPATIEYAFDRAYKLHELWIWNSNQIIEAFVGFGAKDVVIEHSLDGENWTVLEGVGPLAQAPGAAGYAHNNTIDFGGVTARHVRMTINSVQGVAPQVSLSEVRFFFIPTTAAQPNPETGASAVAPDVTLAWGRAGREADRHEIYLGSDPSALPLVGSVGASSFDTSALDLKLGETYSWRVDEVNEAMDPSIWMGDVWSFSTVDVISVDDMESYKDEEFLEIWATWVDGFDDPANGSLVGVGAAGTPETDIVHGGGQSLPMEYGIDGAAQSEATRTFDAAMDWTGHGVQGLVLYFQGSGANTGGSLYVKINDTRVTYDDDPAALMRGGWNKWYVSLADVAGNLSSVTSLTIGVDGGGAGIVYVDDIFLTADGRELITPMAASSEGLLVHWAFDEAAGDTVGDASGNNHAGTINGATWTAGGFDGSGHSLAFGGDGDFVIDSDTVMSQLNGLSAVTVAVWVKSNVIDTDHGFINFIAPDDGDNGGMRYDAAGASFGGANVMKMSLHTTDGNLQLESSGGAQTTEWQHLAMSWQSGESLRLYINGVLDTPTGASDPAVGTVDTVTRLLVGRSGKDDLVSEGWEGLIDDVRIYSRVLSDEEAAGLAGRTLPFDRP